MLGLDPAVVTPDLMPAIVDAIRDADPEDLQTLQDLSELVDGAVQTAADALALLAAYDVSNAEPGPQTSAVAGADGVPTANLPAGDRRGARLRGADPAQPPGVQPTLHTTAQGP